MQKGKCAALCYLSGAPESRFLLWHGRQPQTGATAATGSARPATPIPRAQDGHAVHSLMAQAETPQRRELSFCSLLLASAPGRRER